MVSHSLTNSAHSALMGGSMERTFDVLLSITTADIFEQ